MIDDTIKKDTIEEKQIEEPAKVVNTPVTEPEVVDVNLGFVEKRKFRINGDYNRMLELNVSDLNIATRLKTGYPKLQELLAEAQQKITGIPDTDDSFEELGKVADALTEIDKKMRETIDYIFDTNASEVCAPSGNMYDPVGGEFRFMHIIDVVSKLYTNGLDEEFKKVKNRVETKTSKYTKKGSKYHK